MNTLDKAISNKIKSGKDKIEVLKQSMRNTIHEIEECLDSAGDHMSETMVKLLETITMYMRNTKNYFRWKKSPPKMVKTNLFQTGPNKWAQSSNAKTTNIHKWLHDKKI